MKRIMKTIAVCLAALLCGCSITGHLERRQYRADVLHVSREQYEREQQTYQPPALKIERDSNRFYLVPTEVQENGERIMAMQIQEVTIRATTRTLPERLGKVTIDFVIDMPRQLRRSTSPARHYHPRRTVLPCSGPRLLAIQQIPARIQPLGNRSRKSFRPLCKISLQRRLTTGQHRSTSGAYLILLFAGSTYG